MKFDPVPYCKPTTEPVGYFFASLSPDGWCETAYQPSLSARLEPEELKEFIDFVNSFFKECNAQDALVKYIKKNGTKVDGTTKSVSHNGKLLDYVVSVSGYAVTFYPYRKENT